MQMFGKAFTDDLSGKNTEAALETITHHDFCTTFYHGQQRPMAKDPVVVQKTPRGTLSARHPFSLSDSTPVE